MVDALDLTTSNDAEGRVPRKALEALESLLASSNLSHVHYLGWAREEVLRRLCSHESLKVTVMDMPDAWGRGGDFLADFDEPSSPIDVPEWLRNIPFYVEGCPESDLFICDWSWGENADTFLSRRMNNCDCGPRCIFLFGDALKTERHPNYSWTTGEGWAAGTNGQVLPVTIRQIRKAKNVFRARRHYSLKVYFSIKDHEREIKSLSPEQAFRHFVRLSKRFIVYLGHRNSTRRKHRRREIALRRLIRLHKKKGDHLTARAYEQRLIRHFHARGGGGTLRWDLSLPPALSVKKRKRWLRRKRALHRNKRKTSSRNL